MGNILTGNGHTYTYGDDKGWEDLLTKVDGQSITYDNIGNPTSYYNGTRWTFTWEQGRNLATASGGGNTISYTYDADGIRTSKTVNGTKHTYYYAGGKLLRETYGSNTLDFFYDANGTPYALKHNGTTYYYVTNLQGDVMSIVDGSGKSVAEYSYDPYGNVLTATGTLAEINPLRYRSYYYDSESQLYYLQSRYYDPELGRFINADDYASTGQGILGYNMFAYCRNNPVNRKDVAGTQDEDTTEEAKENLSALLDEYTTITETGFSISIEAETKKWDEYIKQIGIKDAYTYMSEYLCQMYFDVYGEEFLFSEECLAYEIEYHVDAYMGAKGYSGYTRNVTTYMFSDNYLIEHCKTIDISTKDVYNTKQAIMFNYKSGIRSCYWYTEKDPYRYMVISWGNVYYERY